MKRRPTHRLGVDEHWWNDATAAQRRYAVLWALRLPDYNRITEYGNRDWHNGGQSASQIAGRLGVPSARRAGRGAVKGSWTGNMAEALRVAPTLRAACELDLAHRSRDLVDHHHRAAPRYFLTPEGERARNEDFGEHMTPGLFDAVRKLQG